MTMFSFHPVKSITTGEGGAIVTNSKEYYEKLMMFRSHGITKDQKKMLQKKNPAWYHEMQDMGFNYRLTDIQAALGVSQMKKLDFFMEKRRAIALRYQKELADLKNFIIPKTFSGSESSWHLFALRLIPEKKHLRNFCFEEFHKAGIGVQVHYIPVYRHPHYEALGYKKGLCPHAELFSESEISIPVFPALSPKEQATVIKVIQGMDKKLE
jgi:dTDP-4-amino-4,6-dideoxygalactose transaminase